MSLEDLYRQFNELQERRLGRPQVFSQEADSMRRLRAVIANWAQQTLLSREKIGWEELDEDPIICHKLSVTARVIQIALNEGMDAAMLWKLQNG